MSKLCRKKKKAARRVKEEQRETSKQTNILQAKAEGVYLETKSYKEVMAPLRRLLNK